MSIGTPVLEIRGLSVEYGLGDKAVRAVRDVDLTRCRQLTRDDWYAMFPALRGLRALYLDLYDRAMSGWLAGHLPGVQVSDEVPF